MPIRPVRRIARTLLATTFVAGGVNGLMNPKPRAEAATALADRGRSGLPDALAAKVPEDPSRFVQINAVAQIAGGLLLASGRAPRPAAFVLAATVVPGTVTEQDFWAENDPDRKAAKRAGFLKDLGLLGGLLIAAADTEGRPSLGWRARRALSRQEPKVAAEGAALVGAAKVHSAHLAEVAHDRGAQLADIARERGPQLAEAAQERGSHLAEIARERGPQLAEAAQERGSHFAEIARERGPQLAEAARARGTQLAEIVKGRGPEVADAARGRGSHLAELAKDRGPEVAEVARQRSSRLLGAAKERGTHAAEIARERGEQLAEAARERRAVG